MIHEGSLRTDRHTINRREFLVRTASVTVGAFAPDKEETEMSRPYLYHYASAFSRSHKLSQAIARKELDKAGFEILSVPAAWEHVAANTDTIVVVTNVQLSPGKTYVHVIATSITDAPAKERTAAIMKAIKESKMVQFD